MNDQKTSHFYWCIPGMLETYTVNSRFKKVHFSFLKSRVVWFKKDQCSKSKNRSSEKNALCRQICNLRSFLNREFTVLFQNRNNFWNRVDAFDIILFIHLNKHLDGTRYTLWKISLIDYCLPLQMNTFGPKFFDFHAWIK